MTATTGHRQTENATAAWAQLLGDFDQHMVERAAHHEPTARQRTVFDLDELDVPANCTPREAREALTAASRTIPSLTTLERACAHRRTRTDRTVAATSMSGSRTTRAAGRMAHLRRFAGELHGLEPIDVEPAHLVAYLARPSWRRATRKLHRASLADLFAWAHATGRIPSDPMLNVAVVAPADDHEPSSLVVLRPPESLGSTLEHPARAWARQVGYPTAATGLLSRDVLAAWAAAGSPRVSLADGTTAGRWAQLLEDFATWQRARGLRPGTIAIRASHLRRFADAVGIDPAAVDLQVLTDHVANADWSPTTRRSHCTTLRSFFGWAYDVGRLSYNPAVKLQRPRVPITAPRPAPESVIRSALDTAHRSDVRLAIMLAAFAGLRRAEIAALRLQDIGEDNLLRIAGKGGRVRLVPLHPELVADLDRHVRTLSKRTGYLFPSTNGEHITAQHLGRLISETMPPGWTAHKLRTRFGTQAYAASGYDLRAVQELLGHSSPVTTAAYVATPTHALVAAVAALPMVRPNSDPC